MNQNYFQHNGKYYQQLDGLPMGNPLSGTLAEIYINNFEKKFILNEINPLNNHIKYWHRYVDDILILFDGTQRQLKILHNYINNLHPNIKFTLETETNKQINFLDVTITRNHHNKHQFKIYRKDTQTDHTIHHSSNHPNTHKMSPYLHMINRLNSIPMKNEDYNHELNIIRQIVKANEYKESIIDRLNTKYKQKMELRSLTTLSHEIKESKKYITIEYNRMTMNITNKIFKRFGYDIAYRTSNKIMSRTNQTHTTIEHESGVYKLKCNDCNAFYIGQTGRNFHKRFSEHVQEIGKRNIKSNYAQHLTTTNHTYTDYNANLIVLHRSKKGENLNRMEEIQIYTNRHNQIILNDKAPYNDVYEYIITNRQ